MPTRSRELKLHSEAQAELQTSVSFYRERGGERLAERFKEHVEAGFKAIMANPERFPPARYRRSIPTPDRTMCGTHSFCWSNRRWKG